MLVDSRKILDFLEASVYSVKRFSDFELTTGHIDFDRIPLQSNTAISIMSSLSFEWHNNFFRYDKWVHK